MFSGKKSGLLVLTIYSPYDIHQHYIEEIVSVDESLVTNLREVLTKFCIIQDLRLKLSNSEFRKSWNIHNLQLRVE